ncbi:MAG: hypothetical protein K9L61_00285, partial [Candidatus Omnitrophica bacterium]|nr:hypothetical protein [Candidatus Omnitrophota bacterium]
KLIEAKKKRLEVRKEYIDLKKEINQLKNDLKLAKREAIIKRKFDKKKKVNKTNPEASLDKAIMYLDIAVKHQSLGEKDEANENFQKAINQKPDLGQYLFDKGLENYYLDNIWEAREYLHKAKKIFEFNQNYQKIGLVDEYINKTLKQ